MLDDGRAQPRDKVGGLTSEDEKIMDDIIFTSRDEDVQLEEDILKEAAKKQAALNKEAKIALNKSQGSDLSVSSSDSSDTSSDEKKMDSSPWQAKERAKGRQELGIQK